MVSIWLVLAWCGGSWAEKSASNGDTTPQVCNDTQCFKVEVASTVEAQQQWLMWVEEMADDRGMLFAFQNPWVHEFRMKNTLIPLDMIRMDDTGEVLYIKEYAPPCSEEDSAKNDCQLFGPPEGTTATYVLELNAYKTREAGIYEWLVLDLYNVN